MMKMRNATRALAILHIAFVVLQLASAHNTNLQTGDVVLLPGNCYLCKLIQDQEGCHYSHVGIIIVDENEQLQVAEAADTVQLTPFEQFVARADPSYPVSIRRYREMNETISLAIPLAFRIFYDGLSYDPKFLWNNFNTKGEMLYCSEFVAKFWNRLIPGLFQTKPMRYDVHPAEWKAYFAPDEPPSGLPGVSPCDVWRHPAFQDIELKYV